MSPPSAGAAGLDLVIVGAGPAGISAALWARSLAVSARVLEAAPRPGGQLHVIHLHPDELAGVETGDGPAIAAAMERQLGDSGVPARLGCAATALAPEGGGVVVTDQRGEAHRAGAALIATGVRRRRLAVPGDRELEGRGVTYSATRDLDALAGRRVLVVGGGDGAFENALILADSGCRVTVAVRGAPRARAEFRERVAASAAIDVRERAGVAAIEGTERVEAARLRTAAGEERLPCEAVVVKIGVVPNTEWCRGAVELDAAGYVVTRAHGGTSAERVWAAGDVARPLLPSVPVALGAAALAVAEIRKRRG